MNYSFYCRQSKMNSKGLAPIELSIVINGKRCFINLEMKESPSNFTKLLQQKKNNYLKDYLSTIQQQINKSILEIAKEGKELTSELLREYIQPIRGFQLPDSIVKYRQVPYIRERVFCVYRR